MQSISVFLDIANFSDFRWKVADIRYNGEKLLISGITLPSFVIVGYVWQILGGGFFGPPPPPQHSPSVSSPEEAYPE